MIDDKSEEPTPFGTLRYAEDYRIAAEKVIGDCNPLESGLLMPAYNLIGQSIERVGSQGSSERDTMGISRSQSRARP